MTRPPTILPGLVDRDDARSGPRRWRGEVLLFTPKKPVVIATVYGSTLEEMRARKRAVYEALKATAAAAAQPGGG